MITTDKAKKLLGEYGKKMDDKQIQSILNFLYGFCEKVIDLEIQNDNINCHKALKSYN
jgi:PleD family two-component response regulator